MKILFFHRWVGVHGGGTETHILELAKRFCELGHEITILTREGSMLEDLDKRIRVVRVNKIFEESDHSYGDVRVYFYTLFFMRKAFWKLVWLWVLGDRFDVVSVHFAAEAIVARIYRFLFGTPFIFVLEGYTPLEAKTAAAADRRIAISNYEAEVYYKKHGVKSKVACVGVDCERFSKGKSDLRTNLAKKGEILVLTVCRLEPRKDLKLLIKAAEKIKNMEKPVKFVIVGDGISRGEIEKEIKIRKLGSVVKMMGFVPDKKLADFYGAADIFLLTSKEEWFGIVFLEAMAAGLPIIAANVDACPEVVGKCGLFFRRGEIDDLVDKIVKLVDDKRKRVLLGKRAMVRARAFDWKKKIIEYEKIYQSVLK